MSDVLYALRDSSSGSPTFNMNNEFNIFGNKTSFTGRSQEKFSVIADEPIVKQLGKPRQEKKSLELPLFIGVLTTAALGSCTVSVGNGWVGSSLIGAVLGAGIVTASITITDIKSGQPTRLDDYIGKLLSGTVQRAVTGATVYSLGANASVVEGVYDRILRTVVNQNPISVNGTFSIGSGYNLLLDKMFDSAPSKNENPSMLLAHLFEKIGENEGTTSREKSNTEGTGKTVGYQDSTMNLIVELEGAPFLKPRINDNGTITIGYGYDFTQESDPDMFNKYLKVASNGKIIVTSEMSYEDAKATIKKAADKLGITSALDDFINGKGYGNKVKPLMLNQNQYDALFSYFYSNGKNVFTDSKYNEWIELGGERAKRAEARKELRDYLINQNGDYNADMITYLFVESKGANIKYDYRSRRETEANVFNQK